MENKRSEEIVKNEYYYLTSELSTINDEVDSVKGKKSSILSGLKQIRSELSSIIENEDSLKYNLMSDKDDFISKKEIKLFNSIIALSFIPAILSALLLVVTGNSHVISDMGIYSIVFTGFPQFFVGTGLYYSILNILEKKYDKEFVKTKEYRDKNRALEDIQTKKNKVSRQCDALSLAISKCDGQLKFYNDKIRYIRAKMKELETELADIMFPKSENVQEKSDDIKLIR